MTSAEDLLAGVIENPACDTRRLAYADWLEDVNGGNDPARAEFIRDQIWLAVNQSCGSCTADEWVIAKPCAECDIRDETRGRTGLALFGSGWWRKFAGPATAVIPAGSRWDDHIQFRRGFVERVTCPAADWLSHGDAIRKAHPVTKVALTTHPDVMALYKLNGGDSPGNVITHHEAILARRWPGVEFELPREMVGLSGVVTAVAFQSMYLNEWPQRDPRMEALDNYIEGLEAELAGIRIAAPPPSPSLAGVMATVRDTESAIFARLDYARRMRNRAARDSSVILGISDVREWIERRLAMPSRRG